MSLKLKKYDTEQIYDNATIAVIGKAMTGKTTLVQHLLSTFADIPRGIVFSQSADAYGFEHQEIESHDDFDSNSLKTFIADQKRRIKESRKGSKKEDTRAFVVIDDSFYNSHKADKNICSLFRNNRRYRITLVVVLQYPNMPPEHRANLDYVFMFRENQLGNRRMLFEHFGGIVEKFETFNTILEHCTDDYGCLVIDNTTRSNKLSDNCFWYKVDAQEAEEIEAETTATVDDDDNTVSGGGGGDPAEEGGCSIM